MSPQTSRTEAACLAKTPGGHSWGAAERAAITAKAGSHAQGPTRDREATASESDRVWVVWLEVPSHRAGVPNPTPRANHLRNFRKKKRCPAPPLPGHPHPH